ncbi:MAG TPA: hypothetical protein VEZ20_00430 [Allosphingosinicella sp.]|nr:hypothetical protein [Allosphingosinicella sp.]
MPGEGEQLVLTRLPSGDRLSVRRTSAPARLPALPLGANLLADAAARTTFGVEERCRVEAREGGIDLICLPGTFAAGLLLRFDARYPAGAAASGMIEARGDPGFQAQFGHRGEDAAEPRNVSARRGLPIPSERGERAAQLVILAPAAGGTLHIGRVGLVPASRRSTARAGAWAWQPALWRESGDALLRSAAARGLGRLSVTLAISEGRIENAEALAAFVRSARRQGIAVEAVEGDPDMVFAHGLASAAARARAIAAYQRTAAPAARLAGVQYDIEPYTLASWGQEPAGYRGWSEAVRTLARSAGQPIHLVLPFWIAEGEEGQAFLRAVQASVSGVTVMAYRTEAALVSVVAEPLLNWGSANGKPVRVALETGPVAEEVEESFVAAPRGRIALSGAGRQVTATLLDRGGAVPGARMFALAGRTTAPPARISFLGDDRRMLETSRALAGALSAWSSFDGFSYHGLAWPVD